MQITKKVGLGAAALIVLGLGAVQPSQAQTTFTAYNVASGTTGTQSWTGSLGMDFHVNSEIAVTQLGVFDSGGDGLSSALKAYIYQINPDNHTGSALASLVFTVANPGTLEGGSRFLSLTNPLYLAPGNYSVVAENYGSEPNYNTYANVVNTTNTEDGGNGLISFIGSSRYSASGVTGSLPNIIDGGPSNRYDAGTFKYSAAPEPSSLAAFAFTGLGALGLMLKARKRRGAA